MQQIRQNIFVRLLCGLVGVAILNLSVDSPDLHENIVPEDLSYNDVESIVEWILEDFCQIENAIPEHDDNDDNNSLKLDKRIDFFSENYRTAAFSYLGKLSFESEQNFGSLNFHFQSVLGELFQPPEAW